MIRSKKVMTKSLKVPERAEKSTKNEDAKFKFSDLAFEPLST